MIFDVTYRCNTFDFVGYVSVGREPELAELRFHLAGWMFAFEQETMDMHGWELWARSTGKMTFNAHRVQRLIDLSPKPQTMFRNLVHADG